jgi:hypothetical protein
MGRRQVNKEGVLSLDTIEIWIVYVRHYSEVEWARQNIEVSLNRVWK